MEILGVIWIAIALNIGEMFLSKESTRLRRQIKLQP